MTIGPVISAGHELSKAYSGALAIEPSLVKSVNEKINVRGGVVCNIFVNNHDDVTRDHLILYGPLLTSSYQVEIKKISLDALLGVGYLWGQDFITDRSKSPTEQGYFSERVPLLVTNGLYGRAGTAVRLSDKVRVVVTFNIHRPSVSLEEEAKQLYPYSFSTSLYGNVMEFPSRKMNYDTVLIAFMLGL